MYLHVVLFLFLIFLFVLSLEQAQNDLHIQMNSTNTPHELHPGNVKSINAGINQGQTREQHSHQNLHVSSTKVNKRVASLFGNDENKASCSLSENLYNKTFIGGNRSENSTANSSSVVVEDGYNLVLNDEDRSELKSTTIYDSVMSKLLSRSYNNDSVVVNQNDSHLSYSDEHNDDFRDRIDDNGEIQYQLLDSVSSSSNNSIDESSCVISKKNLDNASVENLTDTLQQQSALMNKIDRENQFGNNSQNDKGILTLSLNGRFRNHQEKLPYYVSENDYNKVKLNTKDSCCNQKSDFQKINCKMVLMPVLMSENMLKNLLLFKRINISNFISTPSTFYDDYKRMKFKNQSDEYSDLPLINIRKPSTVNILSRYQLLHNLQSTPTPTMPHEMNVEKDYTSENTEAILPSKSNKYLESTSKTGFPQQVKDISADVLSNKTQSSSKLNHYQKPEPLNQSLVGTNVNDQILLKILQNFFKLLESNNPNNMLGKNIEQNTQLNYFTLKFIPDPTCFNFNGHTEPSFRYADEIKNIKKRHDSIQSIDPRAGSIYSMDADIDTNVESQSKCNNCLGHVAKNNDSDHIQLNVYLNADIKGGKNKDALQQTHEDSHRSHKISTTSIENISGDSSKNFNNIMNSLNSIIDKFNSKTSLEPDETKYTSNEMKEVRNSESVNNIPLSVFTLPVPQCLDQQGTEVAHTLKTDSNNDYFNPLIYGNKKMFPDISMSLPSIRLQKTGKLMDMRKNCETDENNSGVISGKVYVTGPENLTPDKIHIINPELLRTIHDDAGPKNIRFILDNCNEQPPICESQSVNEIHSDSLKSKPATADALPSTKESILNQLKHMNQTLTNLRNRINERLQFKYNTDIIKHYQRHI